MNKKVLFVISLSALCLFASCKKTPVPTPAPTETAGLDFLEEGATPTIDPEATEVIESLEATAVQTQSKATSVQQKYNSSNGNELKKNIVGQASEEANVNVSETEIQGLITQLAKEKSKYMISMSNANKLQNGMTLEQVTSAAGKSPMTNSNKQIAMYAVKSDEDAREFLVTLIFQDGKVVSVNR